MSDAYWRYGDAARHQAAPPLLLLGKRPRSDYDILGGNELHGHYAGNHDRGANRVIRDTDSINASYDRYLRNMQLQQIASYGGAQAARSLSGGARPIEDQQIMSLGGSSVAAKGHTTSVGSERPEVRLPSDATNTLFVEGLPANCTRREVSHIFRPFVGYKEVRLVNKESRRPGVDPVILCFVDFISPAHAATALDALQGYKFDDHDRESVNLRLQFARHPGARSGGGHHGRR